MNRKSIGTALLLLAILAALAFIWGNSLDSAVESAVKSGRVRELLQPLLERLVGQGGVTDHLVRKLAHFTEFAVLGALLLLLADRTLFGGDIGLNGFQLVAIVRVGGCGAQQYASAECAGVKQRSD